MKRNLPFSCVRIFQLCINDGYAEFGTVRSRATRIKGRCYFFSRETFSSVILFVNAQKKCDFLLTPRDAANSIGRLGCDINKRESVIGFLLRTEKHFLSWLAILMKRNVPVTKFHRNLYDYLSRLRVKEDTAGVKWIVKVISM